MDNSRKDFIYDRLNAISPKIEPNSIPNPHYISEKLVQCHICFEEVEKYFIEVNKQISILQRALNNAEALYSVKKDNLISNDPDIVSLPSMKDRDSRANTHLKEQLNEIRNYKNELSDLEKLESVITYKTKTLTRTNFDIKLQLRIMESQLKLGTGSIEDKQTRDIMDELKKSMNGQDAWEDSKTSCVESAITDPSKPIDAESLGLTETNNSSIPDPDILSMELKEDPIEDISQNQAFFNQPAQVFNNPENVQIQTEELKEPVDFNNLLGSAPEPKTISEEDIAEEDSEEDEALKFTDDDLLDTIDLNEGPIEGTTEELPQVQSQGVDLDKILDIPTNTGGTTEPEKDQEEESKTKTTPEQETKDQNESDFAALLSQFN